MTESFYFKINDVSEYKCGWILPNGVFFGCYNEGHLDLAEKIIGTNCNLNLILNLGWIKISFNNDGEIQFEYLDELTGEQKYKLLKYCYSWDLNYKDYFLGD